MEVYDLGVIGGGPAGMMAAIAAGQKKRKVVLLERNSSLGKKLLLTGKGRCNFTNNSTIPEIVEVFGKKGKFLYSALTKFSNQDLISFFEERGVKTKVERGKRVFPASDKSQTILDCLLKELKKSKVKIIYNFRMTKIKRESDRFAILSEKKEAVLAKRIVLSTGGKSYPQTGSTGDGYRLAKDLGHQIIPLKPALDKNQLKKRIFREIHKMPKKQFSGLLKTLLPKLLIHFTSQTIGVEEKILNANLTTKEVQRLIEFLKEFSFSIDAAAPLSTAIITNGGVDIGQINSKNMQSKIVPNLYFGGEIIALDGPTGGYNLQKAFSTGWLAGLLA